MADEDAESTDIESTGVEPTETESTEGARAPVARRPGTTAAASAASRARRIGGARPTTRADTPSPDGADAEPATSVAGSDDGVSTAKPSTTKPAKASRAERSPKTAATQKTDASTDESADDGPIVVTQAPPWLAWMPAAILAVCAVAMAVLVAVAAHGVWYAKPSTSALRDRVLAAAKTCTAAANTYAYNTIPQDEARGVACSTGAWTGQYRKAMATLVKPLASKLKASQSIQINTAGVQTVGRNQWTVIVFGQTKVTQANTKQQLTPFAAQVIMQKVGGKWLIANIDLVNDISS